MAMAAKSFCIKARGFFLPSGYRDGGYLNVRDGVIEGVADEPGQGLELVDLGDATVAPGFVDTHIHGYADHDFMDCDPKGNHEILRALARKGTTSILATTLTASTEAIDESCAAIAKTVDEREDDSVEARIQGIFLEGPFFTEKHKGAQNAAYLCPPSLDKLAGWQKSARGLIRKSAIAPEYEGAVEYVRGAAKMGVRVALGHSDATCEQGRRAVDAGANVFVHTYNGMSGLHHRMPGLVGCAMTTDNTYAEVISDGLHVRPEAIDVLVRAKGWDEVALVSDCLRCGGMPDGDYMLGELPIVLKGGVARLRDEGNIAGSVLTLGKAVCNIVDWGIESLEHAVAMATIVPAKSAGIDDRCGQILPGRAADLVVLGADLSVEATYVGGVKVA
jgi:N-acetylglucosamine-6-phosphate deacetylase